MQGTWRGGLMCNYWKILREIYSVSGDNLTCDVGTSSIDWMTNISGSAVIELLRDSVKRDSGHMTPQIILIWMLHVFVRKLNMELINSCNVCICMNMYDCQEQLCCLQIIIKMGSEKKTFEFNYKILLHLLSQCFPLVHLWRKELTRHRPFLLKVTLHNMVPVAQIGL